MDDGPILTEVNPDEVEQESINKAEEEEEDETVDDGIPFTKKMKDATRKIHKVSDALVNAKLGIAMSDDKVWAEGLLIFYEIFRFLEEAIDRLQYRVEYFKRFRKVLEGIDRKSAFETDLEYYYGRHWQSNCYIIRPAVQSYLNHLDKLEQREPLRLLAYIYHMYMGLLSGGQILKKKRDINRKLVKGMSTLLQYVIPACILAKVNPTTAIAITNNRNSANSRNSSSPERLKGVASTDFSNLNDGRTISCIKKDIVFTMNDIAVDLSKDEKSSLIDESIQVFIRNNEIVSTIQVSWFDAFRSIATNQFVAFSLLTLLASIWYLLFL